VTQEPVKIVVASLEIAMRATVSCPWCGVQVALGKTISGDRVTMHRPPWCEKFGSMLFADVEGLRKFLDGIYADMERGDA
jgi:hypothetical protein